MYELSSTEKLILLAVMVESEYGRKLTTKGKVYRRYVELSKMAGIEPITQRRALDVLKALAREGILWVKVDSFGRYGRTTVVKLLAPPQALCQEIVEDLLVGEVAEEVCPQASP
jgi:cell division control protein 6